MDGKIIDRGQIREEEGRKKKRVRGKGAVSVGAWLGWSVLCRNCMLHQFLCFYLGQILRLSSLVWGVVAHCCGCSAGGSDATSPTFLRRQSLTHQRMPLATCCGCMAQKEQLILEPAQTQTCDDEMSLKAFILCPCTFLFNWNFSSASVVREKALVFWPAVSSSLLDPTVKAASCICH